MAERIDPEKIIEQVHESPDFPYAIGLAMGALVNAHNTLVDELNTLKEKVQGIQETNNLWDGS